MIWFIESNIFDEKVNKKIVLKVLILTNLFIVLLNLITLLKLSHLL